MWAVIHIIVMVLGIVIAVVTGIFLLIFAIAIYRVSRGTDKKSLEKKRGKKGQDDSICSEEKVVAILSNANKRKVIENKRRRLFF